MILMNRSAFAYAAGGACLLYSFAYALHIVMHRFLNNPWTFETALSRYRHHGVSNIACKKMISAFRWASFIATLCAVMVFILSSMNNYSNVDNAVYSLIYSIFAALDTFYLIWITYIGMLCLQ